MSTVSGPPTVWLVPCPVGVSPSCRKTAPDTQVSVVPVSTTAASQAPGGRACPEASRSCAACAPTLTRAVSDSSPLTTGNVNCGIAGLKRSGAGVLVPGPGEQGKPGRETADARGPAP